MNYPSTITNPREFYLKYDPHKIITVHRKLVRIYKDTNIFRFHISVEEYRSHYHFVLWTPFHGQCLTGNGKSFYDLWIEWQNRRPVWKCDCTGFMTRGFCSHSNLLTYVMFKEYKHNLRIKNNAKTEALFQSALY